MFTGTSLLTHIERKAKEMRPLAPSCLSVCLPACLPACLFPHNNLTFEEIFIKFYIGEFF
jgi:hypothetical protein